MKVLRLIIASVAVLSGLLANAQLLDETIARRGMAHGLTKPMVVFNNWSAYDELSDTVPQTEELCMRLLDKVIDLKKQGVQIDAYLMDAFWFDVDGGYRKWHRQHWPNGPKQWLQRCHEAGITPGLWFSTNLITSGVTPMLNPMPEWENSMQPGSAIVSLSEGGYLPHLMTTLQQYADMGIKLFKFDFAYFEASTELTAKTEGRDDIIESNKAAFISALKRFRANNPEVTIIAYNGFGAEMENTTHSFRKTIDAKWLEVFDTMYSGDPRPSDVPMMNFWRSVDLYSDQMVRELYYNGLPVERIDNCSFMTGATGTCYNRGKAAWKSSLILNMARGGWLNVWHGNCDLFSDDDAKWIRTAQQLYLPLQEFGRTQMIGGLPGQHQPYGYHSKGIDGGVLTIVNASQEKRTLHLPCLRGQDKAPRLLFTDAGFKPILRGDSLQLGPEQIAVIGYGRQASRVYDLGQELDVTIPSEIKLLDPSNILPEAGHSIRVVVRQLDSKGNQFRSWGGGPPNGEKMGQYFTVSAEQGGRSLPTIANCDRIIWSGLSWYVCEIPSSNLTPGVPVTIKCQARESNNIDIKIYSIKQ